MRRAREQSYRDHKYQLMRKSAAMELQVLTQKAADDPVFFFYHNPRRGIEEFLRKTQWLSSGSSQNSLHSISRMANFGLQADTRKVINVTQQARLGSRFLQAQIS